MVVQEQIVQVRHDALWEVVDEVARLDLLCENIRLVEKENDGRVCKELVVANTLKQLQTLVYPVHFLHSTCARQSQARWKRETR